MAGFLEEAARRVEEFARRHAVRRLYVMVSGGKDSAAALAAVAYAGDSIVRRTVVVYNEIVGNTAPINVETVYRLLETLGLPEPVVVESPPYWRISMTVFQHGTPLSLHIRARARGGRSFWQGVREWGLPVRIATGRRWCYLEHKEKHWRVLPPDIEEGRRVLHIVTGVKAADSPRRSRMWREALEAGTWEARFKVANIEHHTLSPILGYGEDEVWETLREAGVHNIVYNVYSRYLDSLNCVFCPLRRIEKQREILRRAAGEEWLESIVREAVEALEARVEAGGIDAEKARRLLEAIREALAGSCA